MEILKITNINRLEAESGIQYQKKYTADIIVKNNEDYEKSQIEFILELAALGHTAHIVKLEDKYNNIKSELNKKLNDIDFESI